LEIAMPVQTLFPLSDRPCGQAAAIIKEQVEADSLLRDVELVLIEQDVGSLWIESLFVPISLRRRGRARGVMEIIVRALDSCAVQADFMLGGLPDDGGPDEDDLTSFYGSFGFRSDDDDGFMGRQPNSTLLPINDSTS
jgi:hypothetical protein